MNITGPFDPQLLLLVAGIVVVLAIGAIIALAYVDDPARGDRNNDQRVRARDRDSSA